MFEGLKHKLRQTHWLFLAISVPVLLFFATQIPLTIGLDEHIHITRAYNVSKLNLYPDTDKGDGIPGNLYDALIYFKDINETAIVEGKYSERLSFQKNYSTELKQDKKYNELKNSPLNLGQERYFTYTSSGSYSPLPYIPSAASLRLSSSLDLSVGNSIIASRITNGLFAILTVFIALYYARKHKFRWLIFSIALFPSTLYQFSVITADTYTIATAFLFMSIILSLIVKNRQLSRRGMSLILGAGILLSLGKINYAPLLLLILLLPNSIIKNKKIPSLFIKLALIGAPILAALILSALTTKTEYVNAWGTGSPNEQLMYIILHPWYFAQVLYNTVSSSGPSFGAQLYGVFAYLPGMSLSAISHMLLIIGSTIAAIFASKDITPKHSITLLVAAGISFVSIYLALYISFTPLHHPLVNGVQARYFIPLLPIFLLGLAGLVKIRLTNNTANEKNISLSIIAISLFVLMDTLTIFYRVIY